MNREAKAAQVLMHHGEYIKRVEQPGFGPGSIDFAMANQRGKLRIQLGERELTRNRDSAAGAAVGRGGAARRHDRRALLSRRAPGHRSSARRSGLKKMSASWSTFARLHDIGKLVVPDAIRSSRES